MNNIFKTLCISFLLLFTRNAFSQEYVTDKTEYKYFIGKTEPDANWKAKTFDDSGWAKGVGSVGFGYTCQTKISQFSGALYVRIPFQMDDIDAIEEFVYLSDFDDAFVAYINGVEVLRTNIGKKGEQTNYNRLADRSKEAYFTRQFDDPVPAYTIDMNIAKSALTLGQNVLSIQIHNDSINGSDLTFVCWLYNHHKKDYNLFGVESHYLQQVEMESSKFPIIEINTDAYGLPLAHKQYPVNMKIIDSKSGVNKPTDLPVFDGKVFIERRGESSSSFPKWSFNVETQDAAGEGVDTSLLGFPKDNDWILFSAFADRSLIRNELCFRLGRNMGYYEPRTRYCELFYNGEYQGLYVFTEKIKRGKNRVNVAKVVDGAAPENIGYVFKYDKPGSTLQFIYPKDKNITIEQINYIKNYMSEFYSVLKTPLVIDPVVGYKKYINPVSLVDYLVINELTKNADSYFFSTYLHKDKNNKLNYGPLWDYDLAFGNTKWQNGDLIEGWQFIENKVLNIHLIMADPEFAKAFAARWKNLRQTYFSTDSLLKTIDYLTNYIEPSRELNFNVWHIFGIEIMNPAYIVQDYDDEITKLKSYIEARAAWIDANIDDIYFDLPTGTQFAQGYAKFSVEVYPNPCFERLNINVTNIEQGTYEVQIRDINGRTMYQLPVYASDGETQKVSVPANKISQLKKGFYLVTVLKEGSVVASDKFVKSER